MKPLLSTDELINHMKNKGITFHERTEAEAKDFLSYNNYYLKLSSYRFNYPKFGPGHPKEGQYQGLDFGYLQELSTIDKYLRYYVLEMCLDIEHSIKVKLLTEVYISLHMNHLHGIIEPVSRRMRTTLTETEPAHYVCDYQTYA